MSAISRQTWALIRRYCIRERRSPIIFLLKFVVWPGIWLGLFYKFVVGFDAAADVKTTFSAALESILTALLTLTLTFNLYCHVNFMVTDKSSGMKSLMISVGLRRIPYYLANFICFMLTALPVALFIAIVAAVYLFDGSEASRFTILLVFILFALHLSGLVFVFNSLFKNPTLASLVLIAMLLEALVHKLVEIVADGSSSPGIVLFIASADPFESVRLFAKSYEVCKNNGTTMAKDDKICVPNFSLLIAMAFWTLFAYLFSVWFDEACPWQTDTANRGLFYCLRSSSPAERQDNEVELPQRPSNSKYFERSVSSRQVGIRIKNVSKDYSGKRVVDDISFNIYRGETTLLLGHNGAGKTTLMNMILGKLMPNKGHVRIDVLNERGDDNGIGVCPQLSVYDDFLSVRQHMELFSGIKSDLGEDIRRRDIESTLNDVSLDAKADSLPAELSGGMKRKLSLGMAFVGKSVILILDEPSSGLDPDSRVFVWNAIRRYRADRTVLLSTQHMEEADYLGDRIAIMSEGKMICCGSSVFLTKLFGSGYKLRIECFESKRPIIIEMARKYFARVKLSDNEHIVHLPGHEEGILDMVLELNDDTDKKLDDKLIGLLENIEANHQRLGIKSHSLRSSSIEDVLLNTTNLVHEDSKNSVRLSIDTSIAGQLKNAISPPIQKETTCFSNQMSFLMALLRKHINTHRRNWLSMLFYRVFVVAVVSWNLVYYQLDEPIYVPSGLVSLVIFHFLDNPVKERVSKFKMMQLNTLANVYIYWISQLLMDMLTIAVALTAFNICLGVRSVTVESKVLITHLMASGGMVLFGLAGALNCYVLSTFFSQPKTALAYVIVYFAIGVIISQILIPVIMFTFQQGESIKAVRNIIETFFIIVYPTDAFQYFIHGLLVAGYIKPRSLFSSSDADSLRPLGLGALALVSQTFVFGLLLYLIESYNLDPASWFGKLWDYVCACLRSSPREVSSITEGQIDGDVLDERRKARIAIGNHDETYRLVAHDLTKSYRPGVKVIDNLSFTVVKGECFGLLGVNGAGKSTTFAMLVGERKPDSGKILLKGLYSDSNMHRYRKKLGYDPQESPILSLSPVEALTLMARLRRVDELSIPVLVNCLLMVLDMSEHASKSCDQLSGGTMRKLALGMSLIGNQEMLALDEPTAGVDPIARRGVWQLLRSLRSQKQISIVISSHAMEECEAICDRISIMARGRLRCIGTFLHLRNKFSQGCTVRIQFSPNEHLSDFASTIVPDLTRRLQRLAGYSVRLADLNMSSATFNILTREFKRSALLRLLKEFSAMHKSLSYIVNDSSLEDIFLTMAREQQPVSSSSSSLSATTTASNRKSLKEQV